MAEETGCTVDVHLSEGYPAVWNHEELYQKVASQLGPTRRSCWKAGAGGGGLLLLPAVCAGLFFFLGTGDTPQLHAPDFAFDDEAVLPHGVDFLKKLLMLP